MCDSRLIVKATKKANGMHEVRGVMFHADSEADAIRKYLRRKKDKNATTN